MKCVIGEQTRSVLSADVEFVLPETKIINRSKCNMSIYNNHWR